MASNLASGTYATALSRNELFASMGLRHDVPKVLSPEEEVLLALPGVAGDFPLVTIATRRRVLTAKVTGGFKGAKVARQAPAPRVRAISYGGRLFSRVKVQVDGGRDIAMIPHRTADAHRFVASFEHLLRTGRLPD